MLSEFELIARYFARTPKAGTRVNLSVGDDAALVQVAPGCELVVSCDMLLEGRHFFADVAPRKLGHKALAVNLSDMAAMGAVPRWALLALSLPQADAAWVGEFAQGFHQLADHYGVELIGGDTTRGPRSMCVTVLGEVPLGSALRRDGARAHDDIWVSGALGDAALGLACLQGVVELAPVHRASCIERLEQPRPRVVLGEALRGLAHSAIDVSDGLLADLGHILERSKLGARIDYDAVPRSAALMQCTDLQLQRECVLAGGDDYELCFTAAPAHQAALHELAGKLGVALTRIGQITATPGLTLHDSAGIAIAYARKGHDHFAR